MYLILVLMVVGAILMARRPRRRRNFANYIRGTMDHILAMGALGANALVSTELADKLEEAAFVSSAKATWALTGFTPAAGDGPVIVGYAHSDYTDSEIEEWVEQTTGWAQGDKVSREISGRFIRRVGVFPIPPDLDLVDTVVLNDGRLITTKLGWKLTTGQTLSIWAYNTSSSPLTSGGLVVLNGHANIWTK